MCPEIVFLVHHSYLRLHQVDPWTLADRELTLMTMLRDQRTIHLADQALVLH